MRPRAEKGGKQRDPTCSYRKWKSGAVGVGKRMMGKIERIRERDWLRERRG